MTFFLFFAEARSQDAIRIDTVSYSYYNTVFNGYTHVKSYQITNMSDKEYLTWVSDTPTEGKSASVLVHDYFRKRKNDFSYIQWMHEEDSGRPISNWTIGTSFLKRIKPNEDFSYIIVKNNDSLVMYDERIVVISRDEVESCIGGTAFSFDESLFFPFSSICLSDGVLEIPSKIAIGYKQLPMLSIEKEEIYPLLDNAVNLFDNAENNDKDIKKEENIHHTNDSIIVIYVNFSRLNKFLEYSIIYSPSNNCLTIHPVVNKNHVMIVQDDDKQKFISFIDEFYISKKSAIIERKTLKDERVEYDIPRIGVSCFNGTSKTLCSQTYLGDGEYELVFSPGFMDFQKLLIKLVNECDRNYMTPKPLYRCRYY